VPVQWFTLSECFLVTSMIIELSAFGTNAYSYNINPLLLYSFQLNIDRHITLAQEHSAYRIYMPT